MQGLTRVVPEDDITVIVNTGDDIVIFNLYICPDLDINTYTLAGVVDPIKKWGIQNDTFHCLDYLNKLGHDTWFNLGDKDLAVHIHRTMLLNAAWTLSEITADITKKYGLKLKLIPMSNEKITTMIHTGNDYINFQEFLVKRKSKDQVVKVVYENIEEAKPAPGVIDAIHHADSIIIAPSNPIVSIGPILSVEGIREAVKCASSKVVAISPIIAGSAVKGPAAKLMRGLGVEVSALGVASFYQDIIDYMVIDNQDADLIPAIEKLNIEVFSTDTLMTSMQKKIDLAQECMHIINR